MPDKCVNVNVSEFINNLKSWNDNENVGSILRSLAECVTEWDGKSKLKKLRKFIVTYCPDVMDNLEIMTGITENWRLEDIIYMLKKRKVEGKEFISILTSYVSDEMVDICSEESLHQLRKMKNNFSLENLRDIILLMMTQKNPRFGWDFLDSISKSWTSDKLETLVKMIVGEESFTDISNGTDGGLFTLFPYMKDRVTIAEAFEDEDSDSEGSLVDFIEDDIGERKGSEPSSDAFSEDDSEIEEVSGSDDDDIEVVSESDESDIEVSENDSSEVEEVQEKKRKHETKATEGKGKKRKVIIESEDSDCCVC